MKEYYSRSGITIYHGDCRDVLPTLPSESVDLLLTDPPYGVKWLSGRRQTKFDAIVGDDGSLDVLEAMRLAIEKLEDRRHVYVFGPLDIDALDVSKSVELIWDKGFVGPGDLSLPYGPSHERISFATRVIGAGVRTSGTGNGVSRLRKGSVLRYVRIGAQAVVNHPTEKPVPLLRELIESSSRFGEIVLDPFMGSGSTLVAAQIEGRRGIGIEIEERYAETAAKRLSQLVLPLEFATT